MKYHLYKKIPSHCMCGADDCPACYPDQDDELEDVLSRPYGSAEFSAGDRVTFQPYESPLKAVVVAVLPNHFGDGRVIYKLTQTYNREVIDGKVVITRPVLTFTGGENIRESSLFEQNTQL